jgi:hypothetical protein
VEHELVSRLGKEAVETGKQFVEFTYVPTEKNMPALEFIASIGGQYRNEAGTSWIFPAERLAAVEYDPDKAAPIGGDTEEIDNSKKAVPQSALSFDVANRSERLQQIGENLYDVERIARAIEAYRIREQPLEIGADGTPGNTLEAALMNIWRKVLGRPRVGLTDNFFEVGGTSLRAVQVIAAIKKELKQTLSIVSLFECPTVKLLAAKLSATSDGVQGEGAATAAVLRGQQRRYGALRRKAT